MLALTRSMVLGPTLLIDGLEPKIAERAYIMERGSIRFDGPPAEPHGRDDLLRTVFLSSTGGP
ncbi:hypothetical protein [Haloechinothrix halophila]|uniref:hypothetical protein n=1 Tax=Haloechinothrix halophila TaxID=1069073 RepID=UPI00040D2C55|nr:hypothetical protein [Haloechinothrix halophila]